MTGRIVILASGDGSLAQAVMDACRNGAIDAEVQAVVSDQPKARVLDRARSADINVCILPMHPERSTWDSAILAQMRQLSPDLVVSAGFMRLLSAEFVASIKVINTHPSLLPLFPGAHPVRDTLKAGASVTGATVHWVDAGLDSGEVIAQLEVPILNGDSESTLHERIKIAERILIVATIKSLLPKLEILNG